MASLSKDNLGRKVPTRLTEGDIPREPHDFAPTAHFLERYSDDHGRFTATRRNPPITPGVIATCIREGEFRSVRGPGRFEYVADVDGHEWHLYVGIDLSALSTPGAKHDVLTAFVPGVHSGL